MLGLWLDCCDALCGDVQYGLSTLPSRLPACAHLLNRNLPKPGDLALGRGGAGRVGAGASCNYRMQLPVTKATGRDRRKTWWLSMAAKAGVVLAICLIALLVFSGSAEDKKEKKKAKVTHKASCVRGIRAEMVGRRGPWCCRDGYIDGSCRPWGRGCAPRQPGTAVAGTPWPCMAPHASLACHYTRRVNAPAGLL